MDPDVLLKQIRKEAERVLLQAAVLCSLNDLEETAESLAKNFQDLDRWLSQQGFLPKDWFFPSMTEDEMREKIERELRGIDG